MDSKFIHEKYHLGHTSQRRIISDNDFTYRNIISSLRPLFRKGMRVLDVGCGDGTIDFYLASKGAIIDAVDISENAIRVARKTKEFLGFRNKINFYSGDILTMKIESKYDIILISEVLEHIKDANLVMLRLYRRLKNAGIILVTTPSKGAPLYRLGLLAGFEKRVGHLRRYSREEIQAVVENSGFKVLRVAEVEGILRNLLFTNQYMGFLVKFLKGFLSDLFSLIDRFVVFLFGSSQIIIVAKK